MFLPRAKAQDWGESGCDNDAIYTCGKLKAQLQPVTSPIWSTCPCQQHSNGEMIWGAKQHLHFTCKRKNLLFFPQAPCVAFLSPCRWTQIFLSLSTCQWPKFSPPLSPFVPQLTWCKSCLQTWPIPWSSFQKLCSCKIVQLLSADKAQSILQSFDDTVCQLRMWKKNK